MLSLLQNFAHKAEIRESKDEILIGEIVRAMARQGFPSIQFTASGDLQRVRFRTTGDPVLNSVFITLDRKTGTGALSAALIGSKATLLVTAEIKNRMADPDDLVKMYRTDLANIFKMPVLGGIKLNHELNSVCHDPAPDRHRRLRAEGRPGRPEAGRAAVEDHRYPPRQAPALQEVSP